MIRLPLAYARWMLRDLVRQQGLVILVIAALVLYGVSRVEPAPLPQQVPGILAGILSVLAWPLVLFCAAAIVSHDRHQGYYRSYFSRPVSPAGFYLQRWILGGVMALLIVPVLAGVTALVSGRFPFPWPLLANLALFYLLFGGLAFFWTTLVRLDWLVAVLILLVQTVMSKLQQEGLEPGPVSRLVYHVLPPFHLITLGGPVPTGGALVHVLLYGAGLVIGAVVVLIFRPLGAGGRS
jgi:hypothetical protein